MIDVSLTERIFSIDNFFDEIKLYKISINHPTIYFYVFLSITKKKN